MKAQVQSTYNVTDLVINKNSNSYIPQSGRIECTFHSTCTKEGFIQARDVEYTFKVAIEFTGGTQVKVTLPSGNQFTLDIVTGEVTS